MSGCATIGRHAGAVPPARTVRPLGHYLKATLSRFDVWLADGTGPPVVELLVNRPGEIWIERAGGAMAREAVPDIDERFLATLARQIASYAGQAISEARPLLGATLPGGERIQIVRPPAAPDGHALAIRRPVVRRLNLDAYAKLGAFGSTRAAGAGTTRERLVDLHARRDWTGFLRAAVRARLNILVSGGTSTGKTTFLNTLLAEIDPGDRVITLEDVREIDISHPNRLHLVAERDAEGRGGAGATAGVGPTALLEASLRMRPDRLVLGELRGAEAFAFLRAINTGHPGSLTTVHANSPAGAMEQVALMALQAGQGLARADSLALVSGLVDVIVQLERAGGRRGVACVWYAPASHADHDPKAAHLP